MSSEFVCCMPMTSRTDGNMSGPTSPDSGREPSSTVMSNHPNRGPKGPASNPSPAEVRAAREAAGLSQEGAAALVHCTRIAWARWESEGADHRRMHPGLWELFRLKTGIADQTNASEIAPQTVCHVNPRLEGGEVMDIEEALRWVDNNCYDEATVQRLRSRRVARTLSDEIERLRAEVEALRNRLNALVAELKAKSEDRKSTR